MKEKRKEISKIMEALHKKMDASYAKCGETISGIMATAREETKKLEAAAIKDIQDGKWDDFLRGRGGE
jgi:hypothetical protein